MPKIYGWPPIDLGLIDLSPVEMMAWLYCPVKLPGTTLVSVPENLRQFYRILDEVKEDVIAFRTGKSWRDSYVYITAKTLWVTQDNPGNRPGWHSDGFMTDDLNYIWSDRNGTLFWEPKLPVGFVQDHVASLQEMAVACEQGPHKVYPDKHLLRLDQTVMHRVADVKEAGWRSFVKISVSRHLYNLVGNSINHTFGKIGDYAERSLERNHPVAAQHGDRK